MWSLAQSCRCNIARTPSLIVSARGFNRALNRQLFTPVTRVGSGTFRGYKITELLKTNSITARFSSSTPKQKTSKVVGYWLLGCSGMVFTAVVLGMIVAWAVYYVVGVAVKTTNGSGVTRLTESGLSMVTWKLLGEKLPRSDEEWREEFAKYQEFPEFKYKNQTMTLSEFKWIWWMEFAHRTWGRAIGAAVFLPAAFFWARGFLDKAMKKRVAIYCALVGAQGLMGWYMVKSGLEDRFQGPSDVPRVSQYRLAAHLSLAFILYMGLMAGALRVLRPFPPGVYTKIRELKSVTALAHTVKALAFVTAMSGALVAGLDAGLVYSSFPKMGSHWLPPELLELTPRALNFTENPVTVQFDHRLLGTSTLLATTALWLLSRRRPLSPAARRAAHALAAAAALQVTLGIATLLYYVPTPLAASHQAGSLVLLTAAIKFTHELKLLKYVPK